MLLKSSRRKQYAIKSPNGIEQMEKRKIGGIWQYLYIRGENKKNPVILFLHGGPGSSMMPFIPDFQFGWEKDFTVVQWDQRNTGKTLKANNPEEVANTATITQMLADTLEVVRYLTQKLGKEKVIILGHSWGSVLGTLFVKKYPQYVSGYIGVGQVVSFRKNEQVGFNKVMACAKAQGATKHIEKLKSLEPYPALQYTQEELKRLMQVRQIQQKYNLAMGPDLKLVSTVFLSPYMSIKEGMSFTSDIGKNYRKLWPFLYDEYDLERYSTEYKVPVIYIMGEEDWQTPYSLAKAYFEKIEAPYKKFKSIPAAGHATMIDQPELFTKAILELKEAISL
ncbi:alpha/beta fold hydrolase [Niameybacter massiliensis]|uniref:alpha/beta fold hydrolase n=1 Tax=Niameybacter massiliensis TaxID=1658108 RepID=UPI0018E24964|nr:alpha/beta hydrolase [Niameybacter massiliensis]